MESSREHFDDRVAVVTGGGSGMGRSGALELARVGAKVLVLDLNDAATKEVTEEINAAGGTAEAVACDVTSSTDLKAAVERAVSLWGRLDYALNAAGIDIENTPLADADESIFDRVVAVDLKSVFLSMKYQIPAMLANGGGSIVNIASIAASRVSPGRCAYNASKAGVVALTKTAAVEYGPAGIRVNALLPGPTDTPLLETAMRRIKAPTSNAALNTLVGRLGQPHEMARAALWLLSDDAAFVTGATLRVDGGVLAAV